MKLTLLVLTPGKMEGKPIPITLSQFVIGRDPQCHLRPASALISKRHCAVLVRGESAFVRDFDSTNGTFVNDERVQGERELHNEDRLKVGPLEFRVAIEGAPAVTKPTPVPATPGGSADDEAAAMLLSVQDDVQPSDSSAVDADGIPTGSTVMEVLAPPSEDGASEEGNKKAAERHDAAKLAAGNTSMAAKAILEKYMRRPRH
jgi:pSer/pThr/pTyr-binding forkhead associated (FHA) protein